MRVLRSAVSIKWLFLTYKFPFLNPFGVAVCLLAYACFGLLLNFIPVLRCGACYSWAWVHLLRGSCFLLAGQRKRLRLRAFSDRINLA